MVVLDVPESPPRPGASPSRLLAVRGAQLVPPEVPGEITAPIPRVVFPPPTPPRGGRLGIPGVAGTPVARWQPVTALAVAVILLALGIVGWRLDAAADAERQQDERQAISEQSIAKILPRTGVDPVWYIARAISVRDPAVVCFVFTPPAGRAFANAHGAETCEGAIENLIRQVPNRNAYENAVGVLPLAGDATTYVDGNRKVVNACAVKVDPPAAGPSQLGIFTMDSRYGEGSQITHYVKC